jgi:AcrR family transcriptional regulator
MNGVEFMPKGFTEQERTYIKKRLMEEAEICLSQFGARKTTVDELVKRVNIPKGTFYLFYESKELLLFDVFSTFQAKLQADMLNRLKALNDPITAHELTALIFELYKRVESSFLYQFTTNGDMELLMRKLPEEVVKAHVEEDDFSLEQLLSMLPVKRIDLIKTFSAALRAIFLSMLHKREIGEEVFDKALKMMIHGIVIQIMESDGL